MATSATTATFSCPIRGDEGGEVNAFVQWAITTPQAYEFSQFLTAGAFNTVTFPNATPRLCIIIPPLGMSNTLTLKGVTGDTGTQLGLEPTILFLGGLVSSIGLTLGAGSSQSFKFRLI